MFTKILTVVCGYLIAASVVSLFLIPIMLCLGIVVTSWNIFKVYSTYYMLCWVIDIVYMVVAPKSYQTAAQRGMMLISKFKQKVG